LLGFIVFSSGAIIGARGKREEIEGSWEMSRGEIGLRGKKR
jgi:hypothetical protein